MRDVLYPLKKRMNMSDYLSSIAIVVSVMSCAVSICVAKRDRAYIKINSEIFYNIESGCPHALEIIAVNYGRRPDFIDLIEYHNSDGGFHSEFLNDSQSPVKLEEKEPFRLKIDSDDHLLFSYFDSPVEKITLKTTYGKSLSIKNIRNNLKSFYAGKSVFLPR